MYRGYIKVYRKALDSGLLSHSEAWQLMCYCLLKASHQSRKQIVGSTLVLLKPGELIFGRKIVAERLNSTEQKIRTCLKLLQKIGFVKIHSTNKFSILHICNWDVYQSSQKVINQQSNHDVTNRKPNINHRQECDHSGSLEEREENFTPPTLTSVVDYFLEKDGSEYDAEKFYDYYRSSNWLLKGKTQIRNWQSVANNWLKRTSEYSIPQKHKHNNKQDLLDEATTNLENLYFETAEAKCITSN